MMNLSKNTISELYKAFLLICAIYHSTAEQVGRAVCINLYVYFHTLMLFYQATAEAEETEQIKKLHNLMHRFLFVLGFFFNPNKKNQNRTTNNKNSQHSWATRSHSIYPSLTVPQIYDFWMRCLISFLHLSQFIEKNVLKAYWVGNTVCESWLIFLYQPY